MSDGTVRPKSASGFNFSLFGSGPKWTITCGKCSGTFRERIPMVNQPGVRCPYCGAINKLPLFVV